MKNIPKTLQFIFACIVLMAGACKKDKTTYDDLGDDQLVATGALTVNFENVAGTEPLQLDTKWYTNQNADSFTVSILRYYISNIQFIKADGSALAEVESYHLIDQAKVTSRTLTFNNLPYGTYKGIRFLIGVDSARNVSGAQSGALDPSNGMFWSWSSGYIMAKLEGERPKLAGATRTITFHIGGFSGQYNALKKVELDFGSSATINASTLPVITLHADVLEWFKVPNIIKFNDFSSAMMPSANSRKMADNYSDMFTVKSVRN
jgi:hypothetical protein